MSLRVSSGPLAAPTALPCALAAGLQQGEGAAGGLVSAERWQRPALRPGVDLLFSLRRTFPARFLLVKAQ